MAKDLEALAALEHLRTHFSEDKPAYSLSVSDKLTNLDGHLVIWNLPKQPDKILGSIAKGGTRISSSVSLESVERLAKSMALKNATANLALGGAKSGICAEPEQDHFEKTYRSFVKRLSPLLAENNGPFGGFGYDIGARPEHAIWACDELGSKRSFTGKPSNMGGTDYDSEGIAGLGVAVAAAQTCTHFKQQLDKLSYAVQGVGAMGAGVIRYFSDYGATLTSVSDTRFGATFELANGASSELIASLSRMDFELSAKLLNKETTSILPIETVVESQCDIFFPCAVQDVLREDNIFSVSAKYIVGGANNPITPAAAASYNANGGILVPAVLANPGGIIAAYVELLAGAGWSPPKGQNIVEYAKEMVREKISQNVELVLSIADTLELDPSTCADMLALSRLYPEHDASRSLANICSK